MKLTLIIFYFVFAMFADIGIQQGDQAHKAIDVFGKPTFEYTNTVTEGQWSVKFDVYGWETDSCWYGISAQNNVIVSIHTFDNEQDYINYITK